LRAAVSSLVYDLGVVMSKSLLSATCLAISLWSVATQAAPRKRSAAPSLPWLRAEGTRIVNERGQTVHLKGVFLPNNTWGNWVWPISAKLEKEGKDPMIKPREQDAWVLTDRDFEIFAGLKLNHVVYDVNYELFESVNDRRDANLDRLAGHVRRFNAMGIYVVVNFAGSPGLNVNTGAERNKPGDKRMKTIFEDRWLQEQHVEFLRVVVSRFKDEPGIGGWILTDEPFCPSDADGGAGAFRDGYNRFARTIRAIDTRHLIIAQGWNARERNPGEEYRDDVTREYRVDRGEQGIIYERKIVGLAPDIRNVAYDIHLFDPWFFVAEGAPIFDAADAAEVEKTLAGFVRTVNDELKAPLFITSYGINRKQPSKNRVAWLDVIHGLFDKYRVSAAYFAYKDDVNPYGDQSGFMGIFGHYARLDAHLSFADGKYWFKDAGAKDAARKSGTAVLEKFFIRNGKPEPIACMDDAVLEAFQRFWARR
jgi:endoglucanase